MPPIERHRTISIERTGKDFTEVHEWLDGDPEKKRRGTILQRCLNMESLERKGMEKKRVRNISSISMTT